MVSTAASASLILKPQTFYSSRSFCKQYVYRTAYQLQRALHNRYGLTTGTRFRLPRQYCFGASTARCSPSCSTTACWMVYDSVLLRDRVVLLALCGAPGQLSHCLFSGRSLPPMAPIISVLIFTILICKFHLNHVRQILLSAPCAVLKLQSVTHCVFIVTTRFRQLHSHFEILTFLNPMTTIPLSVIIFRTHSSHGCGTTP